MEPQMVDLLEHQGFVRAVVRGLLVDEHAVDDVVQETCLRALERPPRALRTWLARVARNLALTARRREKSRDRRERHAARPDRQPSAIESASRLERHRLVVEAVLALEEPFRSAILLRFYDDLPPRAIARELHVPVETARSRVRRGLERMRARLEERHGAAWSLALLPLARGTLMSAKKKLSVVAIILGIAAVGTVAWHAAPRGASARTAAELQGARGREVELPAAPEPPDLPRPEDAKVPAEAPASVAPPAEPPKTFRLAEASADGNGALRVITRDDTDRVLAGVNLAVSHRGRAQRLVTAADGRAELRTLRPGSYAVTAILVNRCRSATAEVVRGRFTEVVIVFARGAEVEGEVRHVERGPLADVGVAVEVGEGDDGFREWFNTNTDAAGRYRLDGVPAGTHPVLVWGGILGQDQHPRSKLAVKGPGPMTFDVVVGRVALRGDVRDADTGAPLAGVKLRVLWPPHQPAEATSAVNGLYEILDLPYGNHYLVEVDGFAPRVWTAPPIPAEGAATLDLPLHRAATLVVETLDRDGRLVRGRHAVVLRDASGREVAAFRLVGSPATDWHTGIVPGTYEMTLSAEGYAKRTESVSLHAGENRLTLRLEPEPEPGRASLQGMVVDASTRKPVAGARVRIAQPYGVETTTDRDGTYRFRELKPGAAAITVSMDGYGRRSLETEIDPDWTLDIELYPAATLRLRVTDRSGAPVAGRLSVVIVSLDKKTDLGTDLMADADGHASYRQILPGAYHVLVSQPGVGEAKVEAEISPGENVVRVRLE